MYCWPFGIYCTSSIVPFIYFRSRKLYHIGTVGEGEGGERGGGGEGGCIRHVTQSAPIAMVKDPARG